MVSADAVRVNHSLAVAGVAAVVRRTAVVVVVVAVVVAVASTLRAIVVVVASALFLGLTRSDGVYVIRIVLEDGRVGVVVRRGVGSVGVEGCGDPPSDRVDAGGCGCGV